MDSRRSLDILVVNFQDWEHPYAGGAEVHLREVFGRLVQRGHRVTLLCCGWRGAPQHAVGEGISIHRVGTRATFPFLAERYFKRRLAGPWDVVVEDLNKLPLRVHRWSSAPTALLVHHLFGLSVFSATSPPIAGVVASAEAMLGRLYRRVPVVAVSQSTADELGRRGIDQGDIVVIPNGVDVLSPTAVLRSQPGPARLLSLGRLQRYKRVDVLLHAVRRLIDADERVHLDVVGDGACRAQLQRLSRRLGLDDVVTFHGRVSEDRKRSLLARATLHVTMSAKEGWGLSVLEAGMHGVPSVASFVPGLRDAVIEGRTGRFVRVNDPRDAADVIRALLRNANARRELGDGARRFAAEHSWGRTAFQMEQFLVDVASGVSGARPCARFAQRNPFQHAGLPRNGDGPIAYGVQCARATVFYRGETLKISAIFGSLDAEGHHPAIGVAGLPRSLRRALVDPHGVRRLPDATLLLWELWAWPTPPLDVLEHMLMEALPGSAVAARWLRSRRGEQLVVASVRASAAAAAEQGNEPFSSRVARY